MSSLSNFATVSLAHILAAKFQQQKSFHTKDEKLQQKALPALQKGKFTSKQKKDVVFKNKNQHFSGNKLTWCSTKVNCCGPLECHLEMIYIFFWETEKHHLQQHVLRSQQYCTSLVFMYIIYTLYVYIHISNWYGRIIWIIYFLGILTKEVTRSCPTHLFLFLHQLGVSKRFFLIHPRPE